MTSTRTDPTDTIRPYTISIPPETLDDLRQRLANTRFPVEAPGDS